MATSKSKATKQVRKQKNSRKPGMLSRVMTKEQYSRDARHQIPGDSVFSLNNQIKSETVVCNLSANAIYGVMVSYVTYALQRGFAATASQPEFPFYATLYGYGIINSYAAGTPPQIETMPYWLLCLCQAIAPAIVPFQQGKISYSWANGGTPPTTSQQIIGFNAYGFVWNANAPDVGTVDGFPLSQVVNDSSYTTELGGQAFSELVQYMADGVGGQGSVSRLVPTGTMTGYSKNVSAFCVNTSAEGNGWGSIGGFAYLAQLEVPIFNPLFSVFTQNITTNQTDRFFNQATTFSGDSLFLSGALSTICAPQTWSQKRYPKFHAVDFLEFADVLSKWVSLVQTALVNDPQTTTTTAIDGPDLSTYACPLTLQEQNILLRNVMMAAFKTTQASVQALYPRQPAGSNSYEFVPFVVSATTCPLNSGGMLLPTFLIENIRALVARHSYMAGAKKKNKTYGADVQWWIPVVGQYFGAELAPTDYVYTSSTTGIEYPSYAVNPMMRLRRDSKAKEIREVIVETAINLVDGSTISGSNTVYAYINDPGRLRTLETLWNNWINASGFSNFSSQLGTLGTELGISVLTSIAMTRNWIPVGESVHHKKLQDNKDIIDVRIADNPRLNNSVYSLQQAVSDQSQSIILAAPYEEVLNTWILPVNKAVLPAGTEINDSTAFPRWQSIMCEPYAATYTAGQTGMLMSMQHATYASRMTRTRNTPQTSTDKLIETLAAQGRGGILSGLAASFLGSVFPSASNVINAVASSLPI